MPKKRTTPATPLPNGFEKAFSDEEHFKDFKRQWRQLEKRKGVSLAEIPDILTRAWFQAKVEQEFHIALTRIRDSRSDFFGRSQRIQNLLKDLLEQLIELHNQDELDSILRLIVSRTWFWEASLGPSSARKAAEDGQVGELDAKLLEALAIIFPGDWEVKRGLLKLPGDNMTTALKPVMKLYFEFASYLITLLHELGKVLRRDPGHQKQPWISAAMGDLTGAGLTKAEADNLLRIMELKGSDAADAVRQTTPLR